MDKWRDRKFRLLLYPDDPTHVSAIELLPGLGIDYLYIQHTEDTWLADDEELGVHTVGDPKKPHWHVVIKFTQPRWTTGVAKLLGIKENYIKVCDSFDGALKYLLHYGWPDKHQYELSQCEGTLIPYLGRLLTEQTEDERVKSLVALLDEYDGILSYKCFLLLACDNGYYAEFRRLGAGARYILDEHNSSYEFSVQKRPGEFPDAITQAEFRGFVLGHSDKRLELKEGG